MRINELYDFWDVSIITIALTVEMFLLYTLWSTS
jgi:hypothetical protein